MSTSITSPTSNEPDSGYMMIKFKGDLLYYKEMYEDALKVYKDILSSLPQTHGQVHMPLT